MAISRFKVQGVERSDAAVARELLKGKGFADTRERSLATYLGDLRRGKKRWWEPRREQLQAVAHLTGLELADLGFGDTAPSQARAFPTFPALRPLDLISEPLPDIYEDVELRKGWAFKTDFWLTPDSRHPLDRPSPGLHWLQIPPGHGLDALWQQLLARGHAQCIELAALGRSLPEQVSGKPMILRVARPVEVGRDGQPDVAPPTSPVLVLSRHLPPLIPEPDSQLPAFQFRELLGLSRPIVHKGMRRELAVDWQDRLVAWAIARVQAKETLLSDTDIRRWVDSLLPYRSVVSTPDELIALCGVLHQSGHVHRTSSKGVSLFQACASSQETARRMAKMVQHRYLHGSTPWDQPLPSDQWAQHLQPGLDDTASIAALVNSLVEEKSIARRRQAEAKLLMSTSDLALSELTNDFDIVRHEDGCYHMRLPFLANALVADEVFDLLENGSTDKWARLYLDPSRRVVVEMALWRRTLGQLLDDAGQLLMRPESPLIQLAAEEALFWSIGLKLAQPQTSIAAPAQAALEALATRIVSRTAMRSLKPATRDLQAADEALAWVAICWHWSINVEFPQTMPFPAELAWLFPGWAAREDLVEYAPYHLPVESSEVLGDETRCAGRGAWAIWWSAAQRIANDLSAPPAAPPDALAPALVLSGVRRGWSIDPSWVRGMGTSSALRPLLRQSVTELDAASRKRLLDVLLTAMDWRPVAQAVIENPPREAAQEQAKAMMLPGSWLVKDTIDGLDASAVVDVTGPRRFAHLFLCLGPRNAAVVRELVQAIPRQIGWSSTFLYLLPILPRESWATAVEWLNLYPHAGIARWLWRQDAASALAMVQQASQSNQIAICLLLDATPEEHAVAVADILAETRCSALRESRAAWALARLPRHGLKLEKLITELTREEWNAYTGELIQPAEV